MKKYLEWCCDVVSGMSLRSIGDCSSFEIASFRLGGEIGTSGRLRQIERMSMPSMGTVHPSKSLRSD